MYTHRRNNSAELPELGCRNIKNGKAFGIMKDSVMYCMNKIRKKRRWKRKEHWKPNACKRCRLTGNIEGHRDTWAGKDLDPK